ncbi:MAG TPA: tellurite resistance methyltransferase TehB [Paenalcaligenes sp.]|nr:tellurite resistance methyltransferase TehB [Paenalcaligenes sp.]
MSENLNEKYGLNPAHSEIVAAVGLAPVGKALEMGCSNGRNALFLAQQGFEVTAVDNNPTAIQMLRDIAEAENLSHLNAQVYDIQDANLSEMYDFIGCTVTLMFLNPATVAEVIANMQEHTRQGGYNVIVCAMDTAQYPCPMPFPFTFKEGQLKAAYEGWEIIKYNEDLGTMHNGAQLQFATLIAKRQS